MAKAQQAPPPSRVQVSDLRWHYNGRFLPRNRFFRYKEYMRGCAVDKYSYTGAFPHIGPITRACSSLRRGLRAPVLHARGRSSQGLIVHVLSVGVPIGKLGDGVALNALRRREDAAPPPLEHVGNGCRPLTAVAGIPAVPSAVHDGPPTFCWDHKSFAL